MSAAEIGTGADAQGLAMSDIFAAIRESHLLDDRIRRELYRRKDHPTIEVADVAKTVCARFYPATELPAVTRRVREMCQRRWG